MISISERLRARQEPVGDGSGKWRKDGLCQEAADVNDALVAALAATLAWDLSRNYILPYRVRDPIIAALAKAKGKQE